ncbi:hypothetical protein [Cohnella lupini]|uniref:hypothetical protein n=1 Tax=Cohnella lupini TaxID=1294267 RepID=UPI000E25C620|nr:hypothetical protein [Cohnella lupini]
MDGGLRYADDIRQGCTTFDEVSHGFLPIGSSDYPRLAAFLGHIRWSGIKADNWTKEAEIGDFDYTMPVER